MKRGGERCNVQSADCEEVQRAAAQEEVVLFVAELGLPTKQHGAVDLAEAGFVFQTEAEDGFKPVRRRGAELLVCGGWPDDVRDPAAVQTEVHPAGVEVVLEGAVGRRCGQYLQQRHDGEFGRRQDPLSGFGTE